MDLQLKQESLQLETTELENEYHLELKFKLPALTPHQQLDVELVFLFGDLLNKIVLKGDEAIEEKSQVYSVHSIPSALAKKLTKTPITVNVKILQDTNSLGTFA